MHCLNACVICTWLPCVSGSAAYFHIIFTSVNVITQNWFEVLHFTVAKNLPAKAGNVREMKVRSLGVKDPLEKRASWRATHSSILCWSIPWTEKPGGLKESLE